MKKFLSLFVALLALNFQLISQTMPYKMAFDITTGDTATHQRLIRWVKGISDAHPDSKIEIVFYGPAVDMMVKDKSTVSSDVMKLAASKKVSFVVCEHALQVFNIDKKRLLDGILTVPDALIELVSRQTEGYGYIKVTN